MQKAIFIATAVRDAASYYIVLAKLMNFLAISLFKIIPLPLPRIQF
jgi:hypothetical protein